MSSTTPGTTQLQLQPHAEAYYADRPDVGVTAVTLVVSCFLQELQ